MSGYNHDVSEQDVKKQEVRSSCKIKSFEDVGERPSKITAKYLRENTPQSTSSIHFFDLKAFSEAMYRERSKFLPMLPTFLIEVHEDITVLKPVPSKIKPYVLLINYIDCSFIVFGCESNLKVMCEVETLYVDGSFNFCTKFFA